MWLFVINISQLLPVNLALRRIFTLIIRFGVTGLKIITILLMSISEYLRAFLDHLPDFFGISFKAPAKMKKKVLEKLKVPKMFPSLHVFSALMLLHTRRSDSSIGNAYLNVSQNPVTLMLKKQGRSVRLLSSFILILQGPLCTVSATPETPSSVSVQNAERSVSRWLRIIRPYTQDLWYHRISFGQRSLDSHFRCVRRASELFTRSSPFYLSKSVPFDEHLLAHTSN